MDVGKLDQSSDYANEDMNIPSELPDMGNSCYLLVYPIAIESKTKSGIILADTAADSIEKLMTVGKVVAKGKMAYLTPACLNPLTNQYEHLCEVGDWICFSRMSQAYAVTYAGKKFYVLPDLNILFKVPNPEMVDPRYVIKKGT